MAIVVIGGQSKNIGKTSVICTLIAAMPERRWTAIKISQHDASADHGESSDSEIPDNGVAILEESDPTTGTDSSRYLAAGAVHSLWGRIRKRQLDEAITSIYDAIAGAKNVIIESNSILGWLQPDLYAVLLDPRIADFKTSVLRYLGRADAILLCAGTPEQFGGSGISTSLKGTPTFLIAPPDYRSAEFVDFVAQKMEKVGK